MGGAAVHCFDGRQTRRRVAALDVRRHRPCARSTGTASIARWSSPSGSSSPSPTSRETTRFELITVVLTDLGDGRTEMLFQQSGGTLSAERVRARRARLGRLLRPHRGAPRRRLILRSYDRAVGVGAMTRVVVTGGSGKAGRAIVRELLEHGYEVSNIDIAPPVSRSPLGGRPDAARRDDRGAAGADAVVHLAAIPAPGLDRGAHVSPQHRPPPTIFSGGNAAGPQAVVWASSETTLGLPFEREHPRYAPIDEQHPLCLEQLRALEGRLARSWRASSAAGAAFLSWDCASRTSWSPRLPEVPGVLG